MLTLNTSLASLDAFTKWASDGEEKTGIATGSSVRINQEAIRVVPLVVNARAEIGALKNYWDTRDGATVNAGATPWGQGLVARLQSSDRSLANLSTGAAVFQVELTTFRSIIKGRLELIGPQVVTAQAKRDDSARQEQRFEREMQVAISAGARQAANQGWMQWMQNSRDASYYYQVVVATQNELTSCKSMLNELSTLNETVTYARNQVAAASAKVSKASQDEARVLTTSRERVADYYYKNVSTELTALFNSA